MNAVKINSDVTECGRCGSGTLEFTVHMSDSSNCCRKCAVRVSGKSEQMLATEIAKEWNHKNAAGGRNVH